MKRATAHTGSVTIALIYTRVSSDDQAREGVSLDAQLAECRRYAAPRPGWVLGDEYQDILKGTRDDRPDYPRLLSDVRRLRAEGKSVAVVVAALDRFGRKLLERVRSREEFKQLGVTVHSVREGEVNDMVAGFLALMAEEEVRRLGERVSASRAHIIRGGWKFPGRAPWGYAWRAPTEGEARAGAPKLVLDLDPLAAPYAREAFERAAGGESIRSVARWAAGLPSEARGGKALSYPVLRDLLMAPVYVARLEQDPEPDVLARPRCNWPALVDDETFRRVREWIARHARMPQQASRRFLLTGLIRCPVCGERMCGQAQREALRYRCQGERRGALVEQPACNGLTAAAPAVDADVLAQVGRLIETVVSADAGIEGAIRQACRTLQAEPDRGARDARIRRLEEAAAKARERLKRAALLFVDGALDKAGYDAARDECERDLEAAESELARLRSIVLLPALPDLSEVLRLAGGWAAMLRAGGTDTRRDVLAALVETVTPEKLGYATYRAHIAWTPTGLLLSRLAERARIAA